MLIALSLYGVVLPLKLTAFVRRFIVGPLLLTPFYLPKIPMVTCCINNAVDSQAPFTYTYPQKQGLIHEGVLCAAVGIDDFVAAGHSGSL